MSLVDRHLWQTPRAPAIASHVMQESNDAKITHAGPIYARTFSETKFSAVARLAISVCATLTTSTMGTDMRPIIVELYGPASRDNYFISTCNASRSRSDRVWSDNYIVPWHDTIRIRFSEHYSFHRPSMNEPRHKLHAFSRSCLTFSIPFIIF